MRCIIMGLLADRFRAEMLKTKAISKEAKWKIT